MTDLPAERKSESQQLPISAAEQDRRPAVWSQFKAWLTSELRPDLTGASVVPIPQVEQSARDRLVERCPALREHSNEVLSVLRRDLQRHDERAKYLMTLSLALLAGYITLMTTESSFVQGVLKPVSLVNLAAQSMFLAAGCCLSGAVLELLRTWTSQSVFEAPRTVTLFSRTARLPEPNFTASILQTNHRISSSLEALISLKARRARSASRLLSVASVLLLLSVLSTTISGSS